MKVAYFVSRFPVITETFILYELLALRKQGLEAELVPLVVNPIGVMHPEAEQLLAETQRDPLLSAPTLRAQWHLLRRHPGPYLRLWQTALRGTWGNAKFLAGALVAVPRAVAYADTLAALGVDHVHAHFATHATVAALAFHRLLGVPFSFTAHAHDIFADQRMLREKVQAAAFVVTISEFNKEFIVGVCGEKVREKIVVVRCGVDTTLFQPRGAYGSAGLFTIVAVGSLEARKGQSYLIDACRLLGDLGVDYRCHLIGDGPDRRRLARQVSTAGLTERVRLEGPCRRDQVLAFLGRADVVAMPSVPNREGWAEGIPVALMEAMACSLPVVASRVAGVPELVRHEETGLLVPPGDPVLLAAALARLQVDPGLRERLGRAGRELVLQEYDLRRNVAKLAELFRAVRDDGLPGALAAHARRPTLEAATAAA